MDADEVRAAVGDVGLLGGVLNKGSAGGELVGSGCRRAETRPCCGACSVWNNRVNPWGPSGLTELSVQAHEYRGKLLTDDCGSAVGVCSSRLERHF